jgi:hypothetical protein
MTLSKIIDRSEAQKAERVNVLRAELKDLGYSVVATSYLAILLGRRTAQKALESTS